MTADVPSHHEETAELRRLRDGLNTWAATWALLTSEARFVEIHRERQAQSRKSLDIEKRLRRDKLKPQLGTSEETDLVGRTAAAEVRAALLASFGVSAVAVAAALLAGVAWGAVHPSLPWHWGKALQTLGGGLALWGTLLAVRPPPRSWSGWTAAEHVHVALYTWLLATGAVTAIVGTLISP